MSAPGRRGGSPWLPDALARRPLVPLLLLAATILLWNLGGYGLWESTEARYGEIAARMVRSGDWLTPRFNGIAHFDKPPLAYWASAAGMGLLGVGEAAARLPIVLASLVALAIVARQGRGLFGDRAGRYAFLVLLSSPIWFGLSRSLTTDLWLTLWVLLSVESGRRGTRAAGSRGWRVLAWAALGAGFLTKGPVILLWTALPTLTWAAWVGAWSRLWRLLDPLGVAAFLLLALPWYVVEAARHPGLVGFWLGGQVEGRVLDAYGGEREPWWRYLLTLLWAAGPWIVPAAVFLGRQIRRGGSPAGRYLLLWVVLPILVFSLFPTKRTNYVLPALPALALAAGAWWDRALAGRAPSRRAVPTLLAGAGAVVGVGLTIAGFTVRDLPAPLLALGRLLGPVFVLGAAATWISIRRGRLDLAFAGLLIPLLGLYPVLVTALGRPEVERWSKVSRPIIRQIAAHRVADEPIVNWHVWLRAIPFYLDERVVTIDEDRVTQFEADELWRDYVFHGDSAFYRMMEGPDRILAVVRKTAVDDVARTLDRPVVVLGGDARYSLITNRPTAGEAAAARAALSVRPPAGDARSGPLGP